MKFVFVALAFLATAYAALPSNEYLPPLEDATPESYVDLQTLSETSPLADDGYRYKTVKRYRLRHRRDVSELPSNQYLPPTQEAPVADIPVAVAAPIEVAPVQESAVLADDGYRYKTVKRYRFRHRRDVNEIPSNQYLPPTQEAQVEVAPAPIAAPIEVAPVQESAVLADDGYRYKTVKRYRFRHRRDVNEIPSNQYLPPTQEAQVEVAPAPIAAPIEVAPVQESAVLADDGYRYKTVKRYRYRHRRDVNEIPSNQYLPPTQEAQVEVAPAPIAAPIEVAPVQESAVLADDGYRYKTVKRYRFRHRRDVNEIPSNQYLPPTQEAQVEVAPAPIAAPIEVAPVQESAVLADDGYRYKTVKRYRYRHRRDVNEIPSNQYLPPTQEAQVEVAPAPIAAPIEVAPVQESAVLADDGYRYKTVKRYRYRHRRDVNEIPSNQYLPPTQEAQVEVAPAPIAAPIEVAPVQESAVLADDGYRYKTVKRYRFRHRRDVNEIPSNQYLPPTQEAQVEVAPAPIAAPIEVAPVQESAVLADDGYRYKTVKRYRFRHRRDVNEIPSNQYLPPTQEAQVEVAPAPIAAPIEVAPVQESAVLADDGYRYKTVKRYRFRHRRDVNEIPSNQYLPPTQEAQVEVAPAPIAAPIEIAPVQESAVLADDGYRYKTVKRYRFRHRRDVNEIPSNQYLPPTQEAQVEVAPAPIAAPIEVAPVQESAVLADDGYRYKTVKRYRFRHRRDVSELPSTQYLPPASEAQIEQVSAPVETPVQIAVAQESAPLADDGYRYKTVKRVIYRRRV